jgi:fatty acid desaturase
MSWMRGISALMESDNPREEPAAQEMIIDGARYDVSRWVNKHPGGSIILKFLGRDATDVFVAFHNALARKTLARYRLGDAPVTRGEAADIERDFRALRDEITAEGLFTARRGFYAMKTAWVIGLITAGVALRLIDASVWATVLSAVLVAVGWQQGGWLSHEFLHHAVFKNRRTGRLAGVALGGFWLGYSADWWNEKHNTHHALPNVHGADPDIDVFPALAFTPRDLKRARWSWQRWALRQQTWTVFPIVALARLNWTIQSFIWPLTHKGIPFRRQEILGQVLHQAWVIAITLHAPTWQNALLWFAVSQIVSGLLISLVFIVGHNARPILVEDGAPDFWSLQVVTTRNVRVNALTRWFFGGLETQTEHHLFPTLPRHAHAAVKSRVQALCAKHGIDYCEEGMLMALLHVWLGLRDVAKRA